MKVNLLVSSFLFSSCYIHHFSFTSTKKGWSCGLRTCGAYVNVFKSVHVLCSRICVWMFVHGLICDFADLYRHILFMRWHHVAALSLVMHAEALLFYLNCMRDTHNTHSHTPVWPVSKPWIYRAALKIKFLLQIIFLVIRKYTCSQREECSDAMATWLLLTSPSYVSLVLSCFVLSSLLSFYWTFYIFVPCVLCRQLVGW